jgi:hypothetical protein
MAPIAPPQILPHLLTPAHNYRPNPQALSQEQANQSTKPSSSEHTASTLASCNELVLTHINNLNLHCCYFWLLHVHNQMQHLSAIQAKQKCALHHSAQMHFGPQA